MRHAIGNSQRNFRPAALVDRRPAPATWLADRSLVRRLRRSVFHHWGLDEYRPPAVRRGRRSRVRRGRCGWCHCDVLSFLVNPSKLAVSICAAPDPRPAWKCPRLETCGSLSLQPLNAGASRAVTGNEAGLVLLSVHFSEVTRGRPEKGWVWSKLPCLTQLFREKTVESWWPASRVFEQETGPGGEGACLSGEGIARSGQTTVKPPMSRLGRAGEDPPRFRPLLLASVRRAEVHFSPAAFLGLADPIRSKWSCKKRRRLARSRAEAFRTCSSRARARRAG